MEIEEAPLIDRVDSMFLGNHTAVNFCDLNVSGYHQKDGFVRIELSEDQDNLPRDQRILHLALLHVLFCIYDFDHSRFTLPVTIHTEVWMDNVAKLLIGGMTVGCMLLKNVANLLLVDGWRRLEALQQLHTEDDIGLIQKHILVHLTFW